MRGQGPFETVSVLGHGLWRLGGIDRPFCRDDVSRVARGRPRAWVDRMALCLGDDDHRWAYSDLLL